MSAQNGKMKILLISDTHGTNIDRISAYAEELRTDVCVHAGDFGFYDTTSVDAMSQRELYLLVKHSALPDEEKAPLLKGSAQDWKKAVVKKRLLGMFPDFLADKMRFGWPVYATWGNHDDADVVQRMIKTPVANLRMLHETAFYAFMSRAATTEESTPPERASSTFLSPICSLRSRICSSINSSANSAVVILLMSSGLLSYAIRFSSI